jgi:hypothetical protein
MLKMSSVVTQLLWREWNPGAKGSWASHSQPPSSACPPRSPKALALLLPTFFGLQAFVQVLPFLPACGSFPGML